jgi:hypothetical protein
MTCPSCSVIVEDEDGRAPPWCNKCGADLKPKPAVSAARRLEPNDSVPSAVPEGAATPITSSSESKDTAATGPTPRFKAIPFQPDYGWDLAGAGVIVGLLAVGGLALGFAASIVERYFWLILLFPAIIGVLQGVVGCYGVQVGRVRNPILAGIAGLIGGCAAMISMHYYDYRDFVRELAAQPAEIRALFPPASQIGFVDYIDLMAKQGIVIDFKVQHRAPFQQAAGNQPRGNNLGRVGTYVYWLTEMVAVAIITFLVMRLRAAQPFCPDCRSWKKERIIATFEASSVEAAAALGSGRLLQVMSPVGIDALKLTMAVCPNCSQDQPIDLKLEREDGEQYGHVTYKEVAHVTYPGEALQVIDLASAHEQAACPACGEPPPRGDFWTCEHCKTEFDSFAYQTICPGCQKPLRTTVCPTCKKSTPTSAWLRGRTS